jgi:hypothetical protein
MSDEDQTREEIIASRAKAKKEYGRLFDAVSEILFRHDPSEINYGFNTDEYEIETETILPRLKNCHSAEDVLTVVREEFQKWFSEETAVREGNKEIAAEIWDLWQNRRRF